MKQHYQIFLLWICFFPQLAGAQSLIMSYEVFSVNDTLAKVRIYLDNDGQDTLGLRAINVSFAHREDCAQYRGIDSVLTGRWTSMLEREYDKKGLDLMYGGKSYTMQSYYGIADPRTPQTSPIFLPPSAYGAFFLVEATFTGSCAADIYVEDETENRVNQQGDLDFNPVLYKMKR